VKNPAASERGIETDLLTKLAMHCNLKISSQGQIDLEMVPHMQKGFEVFFRYPSDDGFACFSHKPKNEFVLTTPSRSLKSLKALPVNKHHFLIYMPGEGGTWVTDKTFRLAVETAATRTKSACADCWNP
jgi:hypothetical protein